MDTTYVFDVNETLLDSSALDGLFESAFGAGRVRLEWFAELMSRALICNAIHEYRPFPQLAAAALDAVAVRYGKSHLPEREDILERFAHPPAQPDAAAALAHLRNRRLRTVALTNSPRSAAQEALARAGLGELFDMVLSAETVHRFKPHRKVYDMAAAATHEAPSRLWLLSCHWWDCLGAARLGWKTVFVQRPGMHNDGKMVVPHMQAADLPAAAHEIAPPTVSSAL